MTCWSWYTWHILNIWNRSHVIHIDNCSQISRSYCIVIPALVSQSFCSCTPILQHTAHDRYVHKHHNAQLCPVIQALVMHKRGILWLQLPLLSRLLICGWVRLSSLIRSQFSGTLALGYCVWYIISVLVRSCSIICRSSILASPFLTFTIGIMTLHITIVPLASYRHCRSLKGFSFNDSSD